MDSREKGHNPRTVFLTLKGKALSPTHYFPHLKDSVSLNSLSSALHTWRQMITDQYDRAGLPAELTERCQRFYFFSPKEVFNQIRPGIFHAVGLDENLLIEVAYQAADKKSQRQVWHEIYAKAAAKVLIQKVQGAVIPVVVYGYEEYAQQCLPSMPGPGDWANFGQDWLQLDDLIRQNGDPAAFRALTEFRETIKSAGCRLVIITHMAVDTPPRNGVTMASTSWSLGPYARQVIQIE